ncbi:MAG: CopG family ribbon-helix-helix protein [Promethearchaeia archaeon]
MSDEEYKRFTVSLPQDLFTKFEEFRKSLDVSRSDAIRKAMKAYMVSEENIDTTSGDVVGCIAMIMTHEHLEPSKEEKHAKEEKGVTHKHKHDKEEPHPHTHEEEEDHSHHHDFTSRPLYANVHQTDLLLNNDIQHHFGDVIISKMHIHLQFNKCLEIIAVSGSYERVKELKNSLQRLKSVRNISFFIVDKKR